MYFIIKSKNNTHKFVNVLIIWSKVNRRINVVISTIDFLFTTIRVYFVKYLVCRILQEKTMETQDTEPAVGCRMSAWISKVKGKHKAAA